VLPRIPLQLLHFPGLFAGVVVVAALLVAATAAGPLFLASAGDRSAALEFAALDGQPALTVSTYGPLTDGFRMDATRALARSMAGLPDLRPLQVSVSGIAASVRAGGATVPVSVVAREAVARHVETVGTVEGEGLLVPLSMAGRLGVGAGSRLTLEVGGTTVRVPVAGRYRDLDPSRLPADWRSTPGIADAEPGGILLGTPASVIAALSGVVPVARFQFVSPLATTDVSLRDAGRLATGVEHVRSRLAVQDRPPGSVLGGTIGAAPFSESPLAGAFSDAAEARTELVAATRAISVAAVIIALAAEAAAGVYATRRRQVQASMLSVRGMGPIGQGLLAAAEAVLPVAIGAAAGWVAVTELVRVLGPSGGLDLVARTEALGLALRASAIGVVLYGVAAGLATLADRDAPRGKAARIAARIPWEPVALVLAAAALYEIRSRPAAPGGPDVLLLAFPWLVVAGLAGLVARGVPRAVAALRGRVPPRRTATYFAVRRLASAPKMALVTVTGTAVAVGVLVYAGTLSATVDRTAESKAVAASGSDLALPIARPASGPVPTVPPPGAATHSSTVVVRLGTGRLSPGGPVDVLGVDPATFERGAEWDPAFSPESPSSLVDDLGHASDARVPVIVTGGAGSSVTGLVVQGHPVAVRIVDRVRAWPGMRDPGRALVVVDFAAIDHANPGLLELRSSAAELWERGDPAALRARLEDAGTDSGQAVLIGDVRRRPDLLALTWAIQLLLALGIAAAIVAVVAAVLSMQARQESRDLAYALGRRMGLADRTHRRALSLELGTLLAVAAVLGSALAVGASLLVRARLQVVPGLPGPTVFTLPWRMLLGIAAGTVVVAVVGGWLIQRRARRTNAAEVLRVAG
jgi:hypothetical protein